MKQDVHYFSHQANQMTESNSPITEKYLIVMFIRRPKICLAEDWIGVEECNLYNTRTWKKTRNSKQLVSCNQYST